LNIEMAGIDWSRAPVDVRAKFYLSQGRRASALKKIRDTYSPDGCMLICTRSRTELWVRGKTTASLPDILCEAAGVKEKPEESCFFRQEGLLAIRYLFHLACGFQSMVFAEDKILEQVRDSLAFAKALKCTDVLMERVFWAAAGAAQKVKTNVRLSRLDCSVAERTVRILRETWGELSGTRVLVIGAGEDAAGTAAASLLFGEGAEVCMAVLPEQGEAEALPASCRGIAYAERHACAEKSDIVVNAIPGPPFTLRNNEYIKDGRRRLLVDLAVPRGIEPSVGRAGGTLLFDMDALGAQEAGNRCGREEAEKIIEEHIDKFLDWYYFKDLSLEIEEISRITAQDTLLRADIAFKRIAVDEESRELLRRTVQSASKNAVSSLIYGLKRKMPRDAVHACVKGLKSSATKPREDER